MNKTWIRILLIGLLLALVAGAFAQSMQIPKLSVELGGTKNGNQVSSSLQILALLTVLSLAPAILILTTAFTRITIVLSFARNAIGAQNIPPNQVMIGLSLFLTFFVMGPTLKEINTTAIQPLSAGKIQFDQALTNAQKPMRAFMIKNTYEKDLILFLNISKSKPKSREDVEMTALIPAFIISELKTAFIIGFYIFVPFLIIDLIVASGLMSMGMMMLPPTVVSLPAKLLVFILADGWHTLVQTILSGYA
ncbi:MAG: flagellar type III secretion system pore protein FliP [Fimbriimonadales bacterium]